MCSTLTIIQFMYFCWGREGREMHAEKKGGDGGSSSNSNSNRTRNYSFSFFSCPISIEVIYCGMDVHLKTRLLPDIKLPPFNIYLIFDELYTTSNWCIPGPHRRRRRQSKNQNKWVRKFDLNCDQKLVL